MIFSCTVIHRNSWKRMIGVSIVRRADGSLDVRVRQEVYDGTGTLVDADIAEIAEIAEVTEAEKIAEVADFAEIEGQPALAQYSQ